VWIEFENCTLLILLTDFNLLFTNHKFKRELQIKSSIYNPVNYDFDFRRYELIGNILSRC